MDQSEHNSEPKRTKPVENPDLYSDVQPERMVIRDDPDDPDSKPLVRRQYPPKQEDDLPLKPCLIGIIGAQTFALGVGIAGIDSAFSAGLILMTGISAVQLIAAWSVLGPGPMIQRFTQSGIAGVALVGISLLVSVATSGAPELGGLVTVVVAGSYFFWLFGMIPFFCFRLLFGWRFSMPEDCQRTKKPLSIADLMVLTVVVAVGGAIAQLFVQQSDDLVDLPDGIGTTLGMAAIAYFVYSLIAFALFTAPAIGMVLAAKDAGIAFGRSLIYCAISCVVFLTASAFLGGGELGLVFGFLFGTMLMVFFVTPLVMLHLTGMRLQTRWTKKIVTRQQKKIAVSNTERDEKEISPFD